MLDRDKSRTSEMPQSKTASPASKTLPQRFIEIGGVVNFRDLGGYQAMGGAPVKWGRLYRSGQLDKIDSKGLSQAQSLGIRTIVDLRFEEETLRYQTRRAAFPESETVAWMDYPSANSHDTAKTIQFSWREAIETGDSHQVREAMRLNYPNKLYSHSGIYRAMLERIISQETPLLFHCAAGKDRTGIAAALILALLGVQEADIIDDYLLTQQEMPKLLDNFRAGGAAHDNYADFQQQLANLERKLIAPVFDADPGYLHTLFSHVNENYGGFESYAEKVLDFDEQKVVLLQKSLLHD